MQPRVTAGHSQPRSLCATPNNPELSVGTWCPPCAGAKRPRSPWERRRGWWRGLQTQLQLAQAPGGLEAGPRSCCWARGDPSVPGAAHRPGAGSFCFPALTILHVRNWFQKEAPSSKLKRTPPASARQANIFTRSTDPCLAAAAQAPAVS